MKYVILYGMFLDKYICLFRQKIYFTRLLTISKKCGIFLIVSGVLMVNTSAWNAQKQLIQYFIINKNYFSVHLQGVYNAIYKLIIVDIGA